MRILATADLHYEMDYARETVQRLAQEVLSRPADALLILGDTYAFDPAILDECLGLFEAFPGRRILTAGNHDLWTRDGARGSRSILEHEMPTIAERRGFHLLDTGPCVHQDVAFVGGVGWYDYSFRDARLDVPVEFYRLKMGPGALHRLDPTHTELALPWDRLQPTHYRIGTVWNDVVYVRLGLTDEAFAQQEVKRLEADLRECEGRARAVVCGTHHIPFAEMVVHKNNADWAFGNAFMGSADMGRAMLACPKVRAAVFGHSHTAGRQRIGQMDAINVGSTYHHKRLVEIEV
jgi:predicted phosphohydrolase